MKNFKRYIAAALIGTTLSTPTLALAEESNAKQAFQFESIDFTEQKDITLEEFKTLVENFINEAIHHEKDISELRAKLYNDKNFHFNTNELAKNACSLVYIANFSHFKEETRAQILGNYVPNDAMEIVVNMLSVTNIINSYNQVTLRNQELEQNFDIDKLVSYEDAFGISIEKEEYLYARQTLFDSVKNNRVYNEKYESSLEEHVYIDEFNMLYDYFGKLLGGAGNHNIEYAEFGAQTIINQTVGMDFLESIKVVFDEMMENGEFNKRIEQRMQSGILEEVDELKKQNQNLTVADYFKDRVSYIPKVEAKEYLLTNALGLANRYNEKLTTMSEENTTYVPIDYEKSPENLIYHYIHVYDEINNLNNIMKALGYNCGPIEETKTK